MTPIKLDIISDPICPWCYIGKGALDRALEANPDHPFLIEWHPFQLNPDMPPEGMDRVAYMDAKFGKGAMARADEMIVDRANELGLAINYELMKRTPNTLDAHRLLHWAGIEGRQTPAKAALFKAHFRDGRDIGDPAVLADIAASIGLDRDLVTTLLQGDADKDDIMARDRHARERGVTGVPTFIIGNRHAVVGAQPVSVWTGIIAELREKAKPDA